MNLPIVDILKAGLAGLAFLLLYMAYCLLSKEQEKDSPHAIIIKTIRYYMLISFAFAVMVGMFDVTVRLLTVKPPEMPPVKVAGKFIIPDPHQVEIQVLGVKSKPWYLSTSGELNQTLTPLPDNFKLSIAAPGYVPAERWIDRDEIKQGHSDLGEITLIKKIDETQLGSKSIMNPSAKLQPLD